MIKGAIFDVDGTLLDSMEIWEDVAIRYLKSIGVEAEPDLPEVMFTMSLPEGAAYVKEHYRLTRETDEIIKGVLDIIRKYYEETAPLKPGVTKILEELSGKRIPMTVATSNNKEEVEAAFKRLGIASYFSRIFTCEEVGAGKTRPDIYMKAAEYMGTRPEETVIFEDVLHAIRTAKKAGFLAVGLYDEASKADQKAIEKEADWYVKSLEELDILEIL